MPHLQDGPEAKEVAASEKRKDLRGRQLAFWNVPLFHLGTNGDSRLSHSPCASVRQHAALALFWTGPR